MRFFNWTCAGDAYFRTLIIALTVAHPASAQTPQPPAPGPSNSSELGLVAATGNAHSTNVSFRNVYAYRWGNAELRWESGWLRTASRDGDRFALETDTGFEVVEPEAAIDSQRLFSKVGYQRRFSAYTDWFSSFDAVRDEPSNISRQFVITGGIGTTWYETDGLTFRTSYGISYTDEDLVVENENRFGGYRVSYNLRSALAETTALESELTAGGSFNTAADIRADWLNGFTIAINAKVALKSSIRVLFRNVPALQELELRTPAGLGVGTVEVPKAQLDTNLTSSLVITF